MGLLIARMHIECHCVWERNNNILSHFGISNNQTTELQGAHLPFLVGFARSSQIGLRSMGPTSQLCVNSSALLQWPISIFDLSRGAGKPEIHSRLGARVDHIGAKKSARCAGISCHQERKRRKTSLKTHKSINFMQYQWSCIHQLSHRALQLRLLLQRCEIDGLDIGENEGK
jgi:hypothetical protein